LWLGYRIEVQVGGAGGFSALIANTGTAAVSAALTGLTASTQYEFKVCVPCCREAGR
jgi:hypothetical protein